MKINKNKFFREATIRICGSLDIENAMEKSLEYIREHMPATGMLLYVFNRKQNTFQPITSVTLTHTEKFTQEIPFPDNLMEKLKKEEGAWLDEILVRNVSEPSTEPELRQMGSLIFNRPVSSLRLRLMLDKDAEGGFIIYNDTDQKYNDDHANLLRLLKDPLTIMLSNILKHQEVIKLKDMLADDNVYLQHEMRNMSGERVIGENGGLKGVMQMVRQVSHLDSPVLLLGETGAGKEVIANAIHYTSPRREGPFIKVNCGAIPESLIDSELFGYEKGAFTGANDLRRGRFERANQGTIFLDEIGDLPLHAQVRLLRVIQNKEIERVGGSKPVPVDIRVISATHRNLEKRVKSNEFREDLWFRINIFPIIIPPLRHRKEDIPALVDYFIKRKTVELKLRNLPQVSPVSLNRLYTYDWPGNVRELENLIERSLIQHQGRNQKNRVTFDLPETTSLGMEETGMKLNKESIGSNDKFIPLEDMNASYIRKVLNFTRGKINGPGGAAEILSIKPNTLRARMEKLGIPFRRRDF